MKMSKGNENHVGKHLIIRFCVNEKWRSVDCVCACVNSVYYSFFFFPFLFPLFCQCVYVPVTSCDKRQCDCAENRYFPLKLKLSSARAYEERRKKTCESKPTLEHSRAKHLYFCFVKNYSQCLLLFFSRSIFQ